MTLVPGPEAGRQNSILRSSFYETGKGSLDFFMKPEKEVWVEATNRLNVSKTFQFRSAHFLSLRPTGKRRLLTTIPFFFQFLMPVTNKDGERSFRRRDISSTKLKNFVNLTTER